MVELVRTNDPVLISWLEATLKASGLGCIVLDAHTSIVEGSIGAIPRRVMVPDSDLAAAKHVLAEAERLRGGAGVPV